MVKYRLTEIAKQDLIRIHKYGVQQFGMKQADRYLISFKEKFESIAQNPFQYEAVEYIRQGYRRCPNGADTIYFRVKADLVEIMTIIGRQDIGSDLP